MSRSSRRGVAFFLALVLSSVGCGSRAKPQSEDERHLQALAVLAGQYRGKHRGQVPPNLDALKAFIKTSRPTVLKGFGVDPDSPDALFLSTRDGKPFVYRLSKGGGIPAAGPDGKMVQAVVFYEAEGSGGKRWVAYDLGGIELVDTVTFKKLVPEAP